MALLSRVDVHTPDRGFRASLIACTVQEDWFNHFKTHHGFETLDDYVYSVQRERWEEGVQQLVNQVTQLKDSRLILARFKAAFETGLKAIQASQEVSAKVSDQDMDVPVPESNALQLAADWTRAYGVTIDPELEPSDALRGRVWREFRRRTMTVIDLKKVKTVLQITQPHVTQEVQLHETSGANTQIALQIGRAADAEIGTVVQYYFALRTLAYAWAWSGNYTIADYDSVDRRMISLTQALAYADLALRETMRYGSSDLAWMIRNDIATRGRMASRVRRGWSAGKALEEALRESYLDWRSPSIAKQPRHEPSTPKRTAQVDLTDVPTPPKVARVATVSMLKGGKRICKGFNDARGCNNPRCPDEHVCDVKTKDGACGSRKHNRMQHPSA